MRGNAIKYGNNVNTDEILPARYLNVSDPDELSKHCMEDIDIDFIKKMKSGDIIVAEDNFGCGSSREHAPIAIKASGISCVIASSFARIFFRNAINIGLPILESKEAVEGIHNGDLIDIDLQASKIINLSTEKEFFVKPFAREMLEIINAGGLLPFIKATIAEGEKNV